MIVLYMLLWVWELPQILVGLVLMAFYDPVVKTWQHGVLVCYVRSIRIGFPDTMGQTLGRIVFIKYPFMQTDPDAAGSTLAKLTKLTTTATWDDLSSLIVMVMTHERRHVAQSDVLGPLWGPLYGLAGVYAWATGKGFYTGNWFELDARKAAGEA